MLARILRSWRQKKAPLAGAPRIRRQKTYSARSGYVYQYFYEGQRPLERAGEPGIEFVFRVSSDRKTFFDVPVVLGEPALAGWQQRQGRLLNSTERYAIAKMALFQAFDERENPALMKLEVQVRAADVDAILEALELD